MREVEVGKIYRHFKGHYYYVICVGLDSETRERIVAYKHLDGSEVICMRPEKMFLSEIPDRPDNVTGQKHRFELVENLETLSSDIPEDLMYFNEKTPVYQNETGNRGSKIYADFIGKVFRHYKGNYYFVENISMNSETKEYMVVYRTLYNNEDSNLWVRPATMFFEEIDSNLPNNITGQKHRFELVNEIEKDYTKLK